MLYLLVKYYADLFEGIIDYNNAKSNEKKKPMTVEEFEENLDILGFGLGFVSIAIILIVHFLF